MFVNFRNHSECDKCGHRKVCALKEKYEKYIAAIQKCDEENGGDYFSALVDCAHWISGAKVFRVDDTSDHVKEIAP
jgi:hypothetical protein